MSADTTDSALPSTPADGSPDAAGGDAEASGALRADAERNRQRLLAAAREMFAEHGLDVTLDDIARHAGLGVGTAYRRFPNKLALIDELIVVQIDAMTEIAQRRLGDEDPVAGLRGYMEEAIALQLADRSLKQVLFSAGREEARAARARSRLEPAVTALFQRAQATGRLREDAAVTDIPLITVMLSMVVDFSRGYEPGLYRRYLDWLFVGLLAGGAETSQPPLEMEPFRDAMAEFKLGQAPKPPRRD